MKRAADTSMVSAGLLQCIRACEQCWNVYRNSLGRLQAIDLQFRCRFYESERVDFVLELEQLHDEAQTRVGVLHATLNAHDELCRDGPHDVALILADWERVERAALHTYDTVLSCLAGAPANVRSVLWRHHAAFESTLAEIATRQMHLRPPDKP
jgi:hypothetical protein